MIDVAGLARSLFPPLAAADEISTPLRWEAPFKSSSSSVTDKPFHDWLTDSTTLTFRQLFHCVQGSSSPLHFINPDGTAASSSGGTSPAQVKIGPATPNRDVDNRESSAAEQGPGGRKARPPKATKKRKHRPRVISDGKPKKSKGAKLPNVSKPPKRQKGKTDAKNVATHAAEEGRRTSCRRVLNFDSNLCSQEHFLGFNSFFFYDACLPIKKTTEADSIRYNSNLETEDQSSNRGKSTGCSVNPAHFSLIAGCTHDVFTAPVKKKKRNLQARTCRFRRLGSIFRESRHLLLSPCFKTLLSPNLQFNVRRRPRGSGLKAVIDMGFLDSAPVQKHWNFDFGKECGNCDKEVNGKRGMEEVLFIPEHKHEKMVQCETDEQRGGEVIPYEDIETQCPDNMTQIVPFEKSFNYRKFQPKVHLDEHSMVVWEHTRKIDEGEQPEELDAEREVQLEADRQVFKGRVCWFSAHVHPFLGDRSFSPWKGSVLDSIVGVFLTQNVSDNLSSSAFMSLAATFPLDALNSPQEDTYESICASSTSDRENMMLDLRQKDQIEAQVEREDGSSAPGSTASSQISNPRRIDINDPPWPNLGWSENGMTTLETSNLYELNDGGIVSFLELLQMQENRVLSLLDGNQATSVSFGERIIQPDGTATPLPSASEWNGTMDVKCDSIHVNPGAWLRPISETEGWKINQPVRKSTNVGKGKSGVDKEEIDWDALRREACREAPTTSRDSQTFDSMDYESVRLSNVNNIAEAIKMRGQHFILAQKIKDFLNRLVKQHGSLDLEWLRDVPPHKAKEYLLSIKGLGLKSTECVRLLALGHHAFPVDINVARISVRLGWVPLEPMPESVELHLLEQYPLMDSIQKYLWPRLCKLDKKTLYELHYQMITFGKVFCTKRKPKCQVCPIKAQCRHFASACASAKLALPSSDQRTRNASTAALITLEQPQAPAAAATSSPLKLPPASEAEPLVEEPASPLHESTVTSDDKIVCPDIEDFCNSDEIVEIDLRKLEEESADLQEVGVASTAIVALPSHLASRPAPKLKNAKRLRTMHLVYELPDSHLLVRELQLGPREADDQSPYLLAVWTPGETAESVDPPETLCRWSSCGQLCDVETCFACNTRREAAAQVVRATLLIPCRTAVRGRFPLNGTYFQVNEVLADQETSLRPIHVPRSLIWNLERRMVYFGASIVTICRDLPDEEISQVFLKGFICVRAFDRKTGFPFPLSKRLHCSPSVLDKSKKGQRKSLDEEN